MNIFMILIYYNLFLLFSERNIENKNILFYLIIITIFIILIILVILIIIIRPHFVSPASVASNKEISSNNYQHSYIK
jgi:hypothetical protein